MSQLLPILYSFRRCPYAMRARLALYLSKIPHEHREIELKNKPAEMLSKSPKGTVPVMILGNDKLLEESLDIMKWAFKISALKQEDALLIQENDTTFKHALDRYKYPGRYLEETYRDYQKECEVFLNTLETRLSPFLKGGEMSFIDLALFPFIRQFSEVDPNWFAAQPYPRLKAWLDFFISSDLFQKIMQKYPVWTSANEPTFILFNEK